MGLWFQDPNTKDWEYTDNDIYIKFNECLQELLLWKGEVQFDVSLGIDYRSVFDGENFLATQINDIISKYKPFFKDINFSLKQDNQSEVVVSLNFWIQEEKQAKALTANLALTGDRLVTAR